MDQPIYTAETIKLDSGARTKEEAKKLIADFIDKNNIAEFDL